MGFRQSGSQCRFSVPPSLFSSPLLVASARQADRPVLLRGRRWVLLCARLCCCRRGPGPAGQTLCGLCDVACQLRVVFNIFRC